MRKLFTYSTLLFLFAAGLFYSCQNETALDEVQTVAELSSTAQQKSFNSKAAASSPDVLILPEIICAGTELNYCLQFPQAYTGNGKMQETHGQVQLLTVGDNPLTTEVETEYWEQIFQDKGNTSVCFNHTFDLAGIYQVRYKASDANFQEISIVVEDCGCEESFSYATEDNLNVTFTYVSAESLENAEVKIVCPHIMTTDGFISMDGKEYAVNNSGNITVLTWTGDIAACTEMTFDLSFNPDCSKQNKGNGGINIWTDFTVNGASKKTVTPPANAECKTVVVDEVETEVCSWPIIKYDGCE